MEIRVDGSGKPVIILTPENQGDRLVIESLKESAEKYDIDAHRWNNEDGKGLTFFLKRDRNDGE
jgi:hypothetical protein